MRKTFIVKTDHDPEQDLMTIEIKCAPAMVAVAMDVVRMQTETGPIPHGGHSVNVHQLEEGPIAPPLQPRNVVPLHQQNQVDAWVDAEWKEKSTGPVLPNMRGY